MAGCFTFCLLVFSAGADTNTYRAVYDTNSEGIRQSYTSRFERLQQDYVKSLEAQKALAQSKGDLKATKAALAEIERFQKERALPSASGPSDMAEIQAFQEAYVRQYRQLELEMVGRLGELTAKYERAIKGQQAELTKAGKLDEATAVMEEGERVQAAVKAYAEQVAALKGALTKEGADAEPAVRPALSPMARDGKGAEEKRSRAMALRVGDKVTAQVPLTALIGKTVMLAPWTDAGSCWAVEGDDLRLKPLPKEPLTSEAALVVVEGLKDASSVSFERRSSRGMFVRHDPNGATKGQLIVRAQETGKHGFAASATFRIVDGLSDKNGISLVPFNVPRCRVTACEDGTLKLARESAAAAATFRMVVVGD
jgi:hypothetical protein